MNDKRVIPDGAHHSGLMKDYGGRYNPEFSERHAEAAESLLRDAVIRADKAEAEIAKLRADLKVAREALDNAHEFFTRGLDPVEDGYTWDWQIAEQVRKALATLDAPEGE